MQKLVCFAVVALTGCPPPARYIVADVTARSPMAAAAPVEGAMVAAACGEHHMSAQRTDDEGRARMRIYHASNQCSLTVAKPGFPTVETGLVNVCPTAGACAPAKVDLMAAFTLPLSAPVIEPRQHDRRPQSDARPTPTEVPSGPQPINRMEVAR